MLNRLIFDPGGGSFLIPDDCSVINFDTPPGSFLIPDRCSVVCMVCVVWSAVLSVGVTRCQPWPGARRPAEHRAALWRLQVPVLICHLPAACLMLCGATMVVLSTSVTSSRARPRVAIGRSASATALIQCRMVSGGVGAVVMVLPLVVVVVWC